MTPMGTVKEEELFRILKRLRDVRLWATRRDLSPWAFRQALVMVLELDTVAALERGVEYSTLDTFDATVRSDAREWVQRKG